MKIEICGSMTFGKEMLEFKKILENKGHEIKIPTNTEKYIDGTIEVENKQEKIKLNIIKKYFEAIKNTDAIFVINKDKNEIKNYIGGNSLIEISFAHVLDKKIFLLNSIPEMSYTDEIEAMNPIILNGNIDLIK